jgi:hypothetical protein
MICKECVVQLDKREGNECVHEYLFMDKGDRVTGRSSCHLTPKRRERAKNCTLFDRMTGPKYIVGPGTYGTRPTY